VALPCLDCLDLLYDVFINFKRLWLFERLEIVQTTTTLDLPIIAPQALL